MKSLLVCAAIVLVAIAAFGHDMFLVLPGHHFPEGYPISIALYNGTFESSENTIDRERMLDVSVVDGTGKVTHPVPESGGTRKRSPSGYPKRITGHLARRRIDQAPDDRADR